MKPLTIPKGSLIRVCAIAVLAVLVAAGAAEVLFAKSTTWTGASPLNDLWSNAANWNNGVPANFDNVYFSAIGGTSRLDLPPLMLGKLDMTGYTGILAGDGASIQVTGNMTTSGICGFNGATFTIAGQLGVMGTMNASHAIITTGGNLSISGELICDHAAVIDVQGNVGGSTGAILNMGSSRLTMKGNGAFSDFSAVTWVEGGMLALKGIAGTQQILFGTGSVALHDVTIERADRSDMTSIESPVGLLFGGNVSVPQGTLQLVSNDVEFGGSLTARGEFVYSVSGGTMRFAAGLAGKVDVTAGGAFRIGGAPPDRVRLRQDGVPGGSQWILAHDGTSTLEIDGVEVQDSDASGGTPVRATHSADKGNNTNWDFFGPKTTKWTAESLASDSWSDPLNWDLGSPQTGDAVVFDSTGETSAMDIPGLTLASLTMIGAGQPGFIGELTLMHDLAVTGDMKSSGTITLDGKSLAIAGSLTVWGRMNAAGAVITIGGDLNLNGRCYWTPDASVDVWGHVEAISGAMLHMNSSLLRVGGDVLLSAPSALAIADIGHLVCAGSSPVQVVSLPTNPGLVWLHDITVEHPTSGEVTEFHRLGATVALDGDLDVIRGVFALAQGSLAIAGATAVGADARLEVAPGGGTAAFGGPVTVRGALSYLKPGGRIRFPADSVGVIDATNGGVFEIAGTITDAVDVQQDGIVGGKRWTLVHDGTTTIDVEHVEMQDGNAKGPGLAAAVNSVDLGNNMNWYFGTVSETEAPPLRLTLEAAPNPFNPSTTVRYELPRAGEASIRVYDAAGRLVRSLVSGYRAAGRHQTIWNGRNDAGRRLGSGVYFCRLESNGEPEVRKLLLLR